MHIPISYRYSSADPAAVPIKVNQSVSDHCPVLTTTYASTNYSSTATGSLVGHVLSHTGHGTFSCMHRKLATTAHGCCCLAAGSRPPLNAPCHSSTAAVQFVVHVLRVKGAGHMTGHKAAGTYVYRPHTLALCHIRHPKCHGTGHEVSFDLILSPVMSFGCKNHHP